MMKRKIWRNAREIAGILLCASAVLLTGCAVGNGAGQTVGTEQPEMEENDAEAEIPEDVALEEADMPAADGGNVLENGQGDNAQADENEMVVSSERAQELRQAQIRHYYGGILSQIIAARQIPDGELDTSSLDNGFGNMSDNCFAVTDIDGDGREELIVSYSNASMAGMFERVYDYDPVSGELKDEFLEYPALTYYDNGIIKAQWSHNQGAGEFWPFTLYRYESESDSYVEIGVVETWDKALRETWYEGQPFPDELDTDGDGTLYHICKEGESYTSDYEDFKYNKEDYEEWHEELTVGAKEIAVPYQPMEYKSFAEFTPAYLRMLAEEAGKVRTDAAADLGLLILNEEHFLDAAQTLLSETYGVEMGQPDPDFEEWTVGLKDGEELFSFEALNAGHIGYKGEKFEDVTIFGIYPGISVDGAWEKLKAYGFYASSYAEVENCLITGEGFDNISIWFSAEDNKVTDITVGPYCAFAG